jgi:hypothetical protein
VSEDRENTSYNEAPDASVSPSRSASQVREEPLPASHHDRPQAAVQGR